MCPHRTHDSATPQSEEPSLTSISTMNLAADQSAETGPPVVCLPMFSMTRAAMAAAFRPRLRRRGPARGLPGPARARDGPANCPATSQAVLDAVFTWIDHHLDTPVLLAGGSYRRLPGHRHRPPTTRPRPRPAPGLSRRHHRPAQSEPARRTTTRTPDGLARRRSRRPARAPRRRPGPPHPGCRRDGARGTELRRPR